ncbi:MAG: hypothetical protein IJU76_10820 [Desulfovibrionaceae bacterium]|nr:hypothetical protein [Desulfovibrionaceae bacterium]
MSQVTGATQAAQISDISKVSERNPQLALAMLMMDIAKLNKENATGMISDIEKQQGQKREWSDALNAAREAKSNGLHGSATQADYQNIIDAGKKYQERGWAAHDELDKFYKDRGMTPGQWGSVDAAKKQWGVAIGQMENMKNVNAFCDKIGVSMPQSSDKEKNAQEWDKVIAQFQTKLDTIGSDIQTQMVKMQDMMGQFNSMMQGANSAISQANQVLQAVAKN